MEAKIPPALCGATTAEYQPPEHILDVTKLLPTSRILNLCTSAPERVETVDLHVEADPAAAVEELLDKNADYFAAAENLWIKVTPAINDVTEELAKPTFPVKLPDKETGETQLAAMSVELRRGKLRSFQKAATAETKIALGKINQWCFDKVQEMAPDLDILYRHKFGHTDMTMRTAAKMAGDAVMEAREIYREQIGYKPKIANAEDMSAAETALRHAYIAAFSGQFLINRKLEDLFADDRLAPAMVARLESLVAADKDAPPEYPGLLEAAAMHMAMFKDTYPDCITAAIKRNAHTEYSKLDFIRDILAENTPEQSQDAFTQTVLGAQAVARVVTISYGDMGITAETLAKRVSEFFDELPELWQEAYKTRANARAVIRANALANQLKPYERAGRRRSNIGQKAEAQTPKKEKRSGKPGSKPKNSNQPPKTKEEATFDIQDVTQEEAPQPSKFSVLKRSGESGKQYSADIETTYDIEGIMEHPIVTKFLAGQKDNPAMAEAVQASLEDIAASPNQRSVNIKKLVDQWASIAEVPNTLYHPLPKRRYRPKRLEVTAGNRQIDRLRISYVSFRANGENVVAIESIELRNDNRYW